MGYGEWRKHISGGLSDTFQITGGQSDFRPNHRWVMCNYPKIIITKVFREIAEIRCLYSLIGCWETEGKENRKLVCVSENGRFLQSFWGDFGNFISLFSVCFLRKWRKRNKGLLCQWNLNVNSLIASVDFEEIIEILFLHSLFVCWETEEKEKFVCFFILYLSLQRCRQHSSTPPAEAPRPA